MQYLVNTTVLSTWVRCTNKTKAEKIKHIQLLIALDSAFFFFIMAKNLTKTVIDVLITFLFSISFYVIFKPSSFK